jgi:hypothetical protein
LGEHFLERKILFLLQLHEGSLSGYGYYEDSSFYQGWTLQISAIYFQEKKIPISEAILDTGSSFITLPTSTFEELYEEFFSPNCKQADE